MAATNTIDTVTVRGVSDGLDKVTSDLNRVADAHAKVGQASEEAAKVTDTATRRQLDVGRAFERLAAQIDPAFRAQQQMARGQQILDRAFSQGKIDADQYAASLEKLRARFGTVAAANNNLLSQTGNLAAQFNDIAVQLAAGTNPLQIAVQQGTQISQVLGDAPGGARGAVKALGGAFMSLISPVNLVTIGAIAAGGALLQYISGAGSEVQTLDDKLKAHADIIRDLKGAYGEAAKGVDDYASKSLKVIEAQLRANMNQLQDEMKKAAESLVKSMPGVSMGIDPQTGAELQAFSRSVVESSRFSAFTDIIARFQEQLRQGKPDIEGYRDAIAELMNRFRDNANIQAAGRELLMASDSADKLGQKVKEAAKGLDILGGAASGNIGAVREFSAAMSELSKIGLPKLSDFERVAELRRKGLSDPIVTPDMLEAVDQETLAAQERARQREKEKQDEEARRKAEADARRAARGAQADEDAFQRALTTAQGRTKQIEEETRLYGQYGGELEAARLRIELETAAKKRGLDISDDMQRAIDAEVEARRASVEQLEAVRKQQEALNEAQQYFGDMATDALSDLFIEGKSVEDVFNNIAKSIANAALQAALMGQGPLAGLFGLQGQNGAPGGIFGALFGGMKSLFQPLGPALANGGIMTEYGLAPLNKYASGGIARTPQVALFGEGRMPEAYVPLPDGRSIPVTMQGGPAANTNTPMQVIINNNSSAQVTATKQDGPNGPSLQVQIDDLVANALLNGSKTGGALKHLQRNRMGGR